MLIKQKVRKYIMLLLALFLILQFLPGIIDNIECLDMHAQNPSILFSSRIINTDIAFSTSDTRKTSLQSILADIYDCLDEPAYVVDISEDGPISNIVPVDFRKEIRQSIPNYFHGSKNKGDHLCI